MLIEHIAGQLEKIQKQLEEEIKDPFSLACCLKNFNF